MGTCSKSEASGLQGGSARVAGKAVRTALESKVQSLTASKTVVQGIVEQFSFSVEKLEDKVT